MKTFHAAVSFCEAMSGIQPQHQLRIFFFVHIFLCGRQHQLQAVELIYFAGTRIVIDGYDIGERWRSSLITPLPTIWFGRQANGWIHTILFVPLWISSSISPVKNHPSPV